MSTWLLPRREARVKISKQVGWKRIGVSALRRCCEDNLSSSTNLFSEVEKSGSCLGMTYIAEGNRIRIKSVWPMTYWHKFRPTAVTRGHLPAKTSKEILARRLEDLVVEFMLPLRSLIDKPLHRSESRHFFWGDATTGVALCVFTARSC